jgi:dephospho-CoA kinase
VFVGLTGGIGAGKSEALAAFSRLGAATVSTDALVHELLGEEELRTRLSERWGDEVAPAGEVDRARVAAIVFERPEELAWLEAQLHPLVAARLAAWRDELPADTEIAVVEVPLLFETGMEGIFDTVVSVVADDEVRRSRAVERGLGELEGRSGRQMSQDEKAKRSAHVVRNDGTLAELESELAGLIGELSRGSR